MTLQEIKQVEQGAIRYGLRAVEYIKAADWIKEYPVAASDYAYDARSCAVIAAHFAYGAHPEWR